MKGPAFQAVEGCKPGWLSSKDGAEKLLKRLQKKLARPKVPDMAVYLEDFFFSLRHRKGEPAGAWSIRSYECYQRLRRALARVQGVAEPEVTTTKPYGKSWSWASNWSTTAWSWTGGPSSSWTGEPWGRQTTPSEAEAPGSVGEGDQVIPEAWPRVSNQRPEEAWPRGATRGPRREIRMMRRSTARMTRPWKTYCQK